MGCVSSKQSRKDLKKEILIVGNGVGDHIHHVVSLTSSTYGALRLEKDHHSPPEKKKSPPRRSVQGPPEVINAWELMEGLEEQEAPDPGSAKKTPKTLRPAAETPPKFLNQASPKAAKRFSGKENRKGSPRKNVKASTLPPNLRISKRGSPNDVKCDGFRVDSGLFSSRKRNLGPLFDPKCVSHDQEQIKKMVSVTPMNQRSRKPMESKPILDLNGGENAVVIYTTTLRGIRKTFEDCNTARGIIESHRVRMLERDVSMDSGFKEELRKLTGTKEVKVPLVVVKGRLIGGCDEIVRLEEEGKLGILLHGIPTAATTAAGCEGCGGVRFVMCTVCSGSCKLLGEDGRRSIKCGQCNENGLVRCPICC